MNGDNENKPDAVNKQRRQDPADASPSSGPQSEVERVSTATSGQSGSEAETASQALPETSRTAGGEFTVSISGAVKKDFTVASGSTLDEALPASVVSDNILKDPKGAVVGRDCKVTGDMTLTSVPRAPAG